MINNITKLEVKIGEKVYQFLCEVDSPIGQVHDALSAMKGFVIEKINEAQKAEQPAAQEEPKAE